MYPGKHLTWAEAEEVYEGISAHWDALVLGLGHDVVVDRLWFVKEYDCFAVYAREPDTDYIETFFYSVVGERWTPRCYGEAHP